MRDNVGKGVVPKIEVERVLDRLRSVSDPDAVAGMAAFGIKAANTLGVSMPAIRRLARDIGRDHALAKALWETGVHEARILAGLVDELELVTDEQMERWVNDFDSWDVCDQVCGSLFDRTPVAYDKALEWSRRDGEFVKRAGYVLMATLAVHDKKADDRRFLPFLMAIRAGADDERNFVKKAVNWALRQIGKRSLALHSEAVKLARELRQERSASARWIASDALRELEGAAVLERLARRARPKYT